MLVGDKDLKIDKLLLYKESRKIDKILLYIVLEPGIGDGEIASAEILATGSVLLDKQPS